MIALLRVKLSKVSAYQHKLNTDLDLMKFLSHIKDERQLESQRELMIIKETKRNLNEKLIRLYLPPGFGEFLQIMESMDYYDRPDYEKLTRILEKAKEIIPYYSKTKTMSTLVDQELFEMDPLFLNYNELLLKHKQSKFKKVSNSLVLDSPPSTNTASNHQIKQSPEQD